MKRFTFLLSLSLLLVGSVFSQISTAWTSTQPSRQIPSTFTAPVVAELEDFNQATFAIDILDTIDHATAATALTNIGNRTKIVIDSNYIEDVFGLDPALDIEGRIVITDVKRRWDNFEPGNLRDQYKAASGIFRVRGKFQWVINAP